MTVTTVRILQLISSTGLFGAERVLLELSRELKRSAFTPVIVLLQSHVHPATEMLEEAQN
jgi:hypothetical protein